MKPNKITLSSHPVACHEDEHLTNGPIILFAHFTFNDQALSFEFHLGAPIEAEHDVPVIASVALGEAALRLYQIGFMTCHGPLSDKDSYTPLIRSMISFFKEWGMKPELTSTEFTFPVEIDDHAAFEKRIIERLESLS